MKIIVLISVIFLLLPLSACKEVKEDHTLSSKRLAENPTTTIPDMISHFKKSGFEGTYDNKLFTIIGAVGGGSYEGDDFDIELYQYNRVIEAKNMTAEEGIIQNGYFIMMIHSGDVEKLTSTFMKF